MSLRLWLLFLGAVLLGVGYVMFDTHILAFATSFLLSLKSLKLTTLWIALRTRLLQFVFIKILQRFLTWLVKFYAIDEETKEAMMAWVTSLGQRWRERLGFRFAIYMILSGVLLGFSIWKFGLWLFLFYEIEQVITFLLYYLGSLLENTLLFRMVQTLYGRFKKTRIGQKLHQVDEQLAALSTRATKLGQNIDCFFAACLPRGGIQRFQCHMCTYRQNLRRTCAYG